MNKAKVKETPEQRLARLRAIGLKGGLTTKRRMLARNPYHFEEIGTLGGNKLAAERGPAYYSKLGKLGLAARRAKEQAVFGEA